MKTFVALPCVFGLWLYATTPTPGAATGDKGPPETTIQLEKPFLNFPVANALPMQTVRICVGGKTVRRIAASLDLHDPPERWAATDLRTYLGQTITLQADPAADFALARVRQDDAEPLPANLYHEPLRPQFHFSARQGWLNDPNGCVYADGQYHLFFQHNPFAWRSGLIHWGHATSPDFVHWTEQPEALYPDADAAMWSGSAVVDQENTSGLGQGGKGPMVLVYTEQTDNGNVGLAYSFDRVHFTKFEGNPVIGGLKETNRDPKVFWYAPGKDWVLALYVEENQHHCFRFYTSPDLRHWTFASQFVGGAQGKPGEPDSPFLYECADLWEMPVEGESGEKRWVISGASTDYMVGSFDGKTFIPETPRLPGQRGGNAYYAPQTFNDEPRGRRVRFGWFQTAAPGMPFNQSMSLPSEHKLVRTPEGLRLTWSPVEELQSLREHTFTQFTQGAHTAKDGEKFIVTNATDTLEIRADFTPASASKTTFTVRGVPVVYDAAKGELTVRDRRAPAPLVGGKQRLIIYADRLSLEVYASDGLTYLPVPVEFTPDQRQSFVAVEGGEVRFEHLDSYQLRSAWSAK